MDAEKILWVVEKISPKGRIQRFVFRTNKKAREWRKEQTHARTLGYFFSTPKRAVWGPDNV